MTALPLRLRKIARSWVTLSLLVYGVVSGLCLATTFIPALLPLLEPFVGFVWLLGPAALLFIGVRDAAIPYLVGTLVVFGLVWAGVQCFRRFSDFYMVFYLLAALVWFAFGFLVYAAGV